VVTRLMLRMPRITSNEFTNHHALS
jgi:hypothetical protein